MTFNNRHTWQQYLPGIHSVPIENTPPCMREIRENIGDIGCPDLDGNCGYTSVLAGLLLLGLESRMAPLEFRKAIHDYALSHVDDLLSLTAYRETIAAHSGVSTMADMANWVLRVLLPSVWILSLSDFIRIPVPYWLDFELIAPIVMMRYRVSLVLYSHGAMPDSQITIVYRLIDRHDSLALSITTSDGFSTEAATTPNAVMLFLWRQHYYVIKPTVREPEGHASSFTPEPPSDEVYSRFETSPRLAQTLWYANSDIKASDAIAAIPDEAAVCSIRNAIESEVLNLQEREDLLGDFTRRRGHGSLNSSGFVSRGPLLLGCGVCGRREIVAAGDEMYAELTLDDLSSLRVTDPYELEQIQGERSLPPLYLPTGDPAEVNVCHLHRARGIFESASHEFYRLHPALVDVGEMGSASVRACASCARDLLDKGVPPRFSLANVDFGDPTRLGLCSLTTMERAIIARIRHYRSIIKIQLTEEGDTFRRAARHRLKSHCILFPHDAPRVVPTGVLLQSIGLLKESISMHFCGPKGAMDRLAMETFHRQTSAVFGRWHVVYSWLVVLSRVNPMYAAFGIPSLPEVMRFVEACNEAVRTAAVESVQQADEMDAVGADDVADVRTYPDDSNESMDDGTGGMTYSVISGSSSTRKHEIDAIQSTLRAAADRLGINYCPDMTSVREEDPVNEFERNEFGLVGAFPDVFLYGAAYGRNSSMLTLAEREHLLLQYTCLAAKCQELICFLFDQMQRHSTIQAVGITVRGSCPAYSRFASLVSSPGFDSRLRSAVEQCTARSQGGSVEVSDDARRILRDFLPVLSMPSHRVASNYVSANSCVGKMFAMMRRYGPASVFLTISPDDVNDPTHFRLSFRNLDNSSFPSRVAAHFFDAMRASSTYQFDKNSDEIDCSVVARHRSAETNPVAGAIGFYRFVYDIMSGLIRCPSFRYKIDDRSMDRRTKHYRSKKGAFGYCRAFFGVVEAQGRGSLHFHVLLWAGLSPRLMEGVAHHPSLRCTLAQTVDSMFSAELPRDVHLRDLVSRELRLEGVEMPIARFCPALTSPVSPVSDMTGHESDYRMCICSNGIHRHRETCHHGRHGQTGCRFDAPWSSQPSTRPFQLKIDERNEVVASSAISSSCAHGGEMFPSEGVLLRWELRRPMLRGLQERSIADTRADCMSRLADAIGEPLDHGLLDHACRLDDGKFFSLYDRVASQLSCRNEWVVPFSPLLTAAIRCHSAAVPLGGATESRLASLYLVPYLNKNKHQLVHILTLAHQALIDVTRYPSSRHVIGESIEECRSRNVQHFLTRLLNKLNVVSEVSDVQAASALLGYSVALTSDAFSPYRSDAAIGFIELLNGMALEDVPCKLDTSSANGTAMDDFDPCAPYVSVDDFGASEIIKTGENTRVIVSQPWLYEYRGQSFANFSRIEYASLVGMRKKMEKRNHDGAGRPSFPRFPFDESCPLYSTHEQVLYSVQKTPIMYGSIPKAPGAHPPLADPSFLRWKARADKFAQHYLVAHRPEPVGSKRLRYDWDSFVSYITFLQTSRDYIDRMRYHSIMRSIHKDQSSPRMKDMISSYRARHRTLWRSRRHPRDTESDDQLTTLANKYVMQWESENLSSTQVRNAWMMCDYVTAQERMIRVTTDPSNSLGASVIILPVRSCNKVATQSAMARLLSSSRSHDESVRDERARLSVENAHMQDHAGSDGQFDIFTNDVLPLETRGCMLGEDQRQVLQCLHRRFRQQGRGGPVADPAFLLVTGRPGTGKSFVISALRLMCEVCKFGTVVTTAYAGIAASHIGGQTICSLFQIPFPNKEDKDDPSHISASIRSLDPLRLQLLRDSLDIDRLCCLVIDEASMVTPLLLWIIHTRLRQATGLDLPFGGISIIMFGDMKQLPPVKAISMCQGAVEMALYDEDKALAKLLFAPAVRRKFNVKYGPASHIRQGLSLLRLFMWMVLETQRRSIDPVHTAFISKLWNGEPLVMSDLMQYKRFSARDVAENPDWIEAPLLVATNQERLNVIRERSITYAAAHHTCVLRWRLDHAKWKGCPSDPDDQKDAMEDPSFFEYFVAGAPGFITANICPRFGLANGSAVRYHSVSMETDEENDLLRLRMNSCRPGTVLTISRPYSLNVELALDPSWATKFESHLPEVGRDGLPCISGRDPIANVATSAIVPILHSARNAEWHTRSIFGDRCRGYPPSRVHVRDYIRAEMGFAVTIHKAEGRTLPRMIVALAERPISGCQLTYTSILVAMSRVPARESIRLLCGDKADLRNIQYVTRLRPSPFTNAYFGGYDEGGNRWSAERVISFVRHHSAEFDAGR